MTTKIKGIPPRRFNKNGRPKKYDFSVLEVGEGFKPASLGMVVSARNYGKTCGKVFIQRLDENGIRGVYRQS